MHDVTYKEKITTNHHWHDFKHGAELPTYYRRHFEYMNDEDYAKHKFIEYKDWAYDPGRFKSTQDTTEIMTSWHGCYEDPYFGEILMRFSTDGSQYQVGIYSLEDI